MLIFLDKLYKILHNRLGMMKILLETRLISIVSKPIMAVVVVVVIFVKKMLCPKQF